MQRFQHCAWSVFALTAVWDLHHNGRGGSLVYLQQQLHQGGGRKPQWRFSVLIRFYYMYPRKTLFYIPSVVFGCFIRKRKHEKKWKLIVMRLLRMGHKLELSFHIFYWQMKYRLVFALAAVWVFQSPCKGLLPMSSSELMVSKPVSFPNIMEEILLPLYLWFLCCDAKSCCVPRMCHTEMFTCVHQLFREALGDGDLGSKWERTIKEFQS